MRVSVSRKCGLHNCNRQHYAKGLCEVHYAQKRRNGSSSYKRLAIADEIPLESWRQIKGASQYAVSDFGRVKNAIRGNLLSPRRNRGGYLQVVLIMDDGTKKWPTVHQLVAKAYLVNPLNKPTVNHIDGNKQRNWDGNLEWATYQENQQHALRIGLRKTHRSQK